MFSSQEIALCDRPESQCKNLRYEIVIKYSLLFLRLFPFHSIAISDTHGTLLRSNWVEINGYGFRISIIMVVASFVREGNELKS